MEDAPLTKAHTSARHALNPSLQNSAAIAEQHKLAADGFSSAADGVDDVEALRVLKMLEEQHRQLARIISDQSDKTSASAQTSNSNSDTKEKAEDNSKTQSVSSTILPPKTSSPVIHRPQPRHDISSSIASNLATKRGIPPDRRKQLNASPEPTALSRKPDGLSRVTTDAGGSTESRQPAKPVNEGNIVGATTAESSSAAGRPNVKDEAFERFYSSFGGLLSKLSAPLAFTGLPLSPDEGPAPQPPPRSKEETKPKPPRPQNLTRATSQSMHDVTKIFSEAALKAVKDENPNFAGVQESFLVVPSGGGTVSYANILRADRTSRGLSSTEMARPHGGESGRNELYAEPNEANPSASAKNPRKATAKVGTTGKTIEELEIENQSLKQLTDNLSRRLYMWEKSAQSQSMALQQSMRSLPLPHPQQSGNDTGLDTNNERLAQLEGELKAARKEIERYGRENEKLKTVVMRYRERWEKLKEGARVRREGQDKAGDGVDAETPLPD